MADRVHLVPRRLTPRVYPSLSSYLQSIAYYGPPLTSSSIPSKLAKAAKPAPAAKEKQKEEKEKTFELEVDVDVDDPLLVRLGVTIVEPVVEVDEPSSPDDLIIEVEANGPGPLLLDGTAPGPLDVSGRESSRN